MDNQEMAVHIEGNKISLSGNAITLFGDNIPICPRGTPGSSVDDIYFDTFPCSAQTVSTSVRRYGTYNPIIGKLAYTIDAGAGLFDGVFKCTPVQPTTR